MACFDKVDYHFQDSYEGYLKKFNCVDPNDEENIRRGQIYAGTHIGMYMEWIIKHNLEGDIHKKSSKESLQKVKNNEMNGIEFILDECGGKLWDCDFNEEGLKFAESYYDNYLSDYGVEALMISDEGVYDVEYTRESYDYIAEMIDEAYEDFKHGKSGRVR